MELAEIGEIRRQRVTLQNRISTLEKDIAKYSIEAEEKQSFAFLTKANSFRKTVEKKFKKMPQLDVYSKLRRRIKEDLGLRYSVN